MADDYFDNDSSENYSDENPSDLSASAIFAEMMRQAAARQQPRVEENESIPFIQAEEQAQQMPPPAEVPIDPPQFEEPKPASKSTIPKEIKSDTLGNKKQLAEAMEAQRIRRVKRRRERRRRRTVGAIGGFIRTVLVVIISAGLVSTILTWFTDPQFLNPSVVKGLQSDRPQLLTDVTSVPTLQPTQIVTPNWLQRIGIVSGHRGPENDPGAVCDDGLTENEINFSVAQRVVNNLRALNYTVDLLDEFDPRLNNYQAAALVSIHSNTCEDYGEVVSGYLVAKASSRPDGGVDALLAACLAKKYEELVPLERRSTLTLDMTDYHTFREIHPLTPAAIIELGFMLADRKLLTEQPDLLAQAITNGITCFLQPGDDFPELTPVGDLPDNFVPLATATITDQ